MILLSRKVVHRRIEPPRRRVNFYRLPAVRERRLLSAARPFRNFVQIARSVRTECPILTAAHLLMTRGGGRARGAGPGIGLTGRGRRRGVQRILVIDEQAIVREPLAAALASAGYRTAVAGDAPAALAAARRDTPDLILTDLALGGMLGLAMLREM